VTNTHPLAALAALAEQPLPGAQTTPLVADPQGAVEDPRLARMLLASMIDEPELPGVFEPLVTALLDDPQSCGSHLALIQTAAAQLLALLEQHPEDDRLRGWCERATANMGTTAECTRAYSTEGRSNPEAVWFPMPDQANNPQPVYDVVPFVKRTPILDKQAKIGSAGSCFASEISYRLQKEGFNYVIREPNPSKANGMDMASAKWGIIFNVPCLRQLVEGSFGERVMPPLVWSSTTKDGTVWRDPWREEVEYADLAEYGPSWEQHLAASRQVLEEVDVFVMTLGLNDVWELPSDGTVFSRCPWRLSPALVRMRTLTVEENLEHLEAMWSLWKKHNPRVQLIVTVSPVPLLATFKGDEEHVLTANCSSKATLRVAAEQFARAHGDVHYFPSFETVMYCTRERWRPDNRHVSREAVGKVMGLFDRMFLREEVRQPEPPAHDAPTPDGARPDWRVLAEEARVSQELRAFLDGTPSQGTELESLLESYADSFERWSRTGHLEQTLYEAQRRLYPLSRGLISELLLDIRRRVHPPPRWTPIASKACSAPSTVKLWPGSSPRFSRTVWPSFRAP
jgi:GSCFA family